MWSNARRLGAVASLCALLLSACAHRPETVQTVPEPGQGTPVPHKRLDERLAPEVSVETRRGAAASLARVPPSHCPFGRPSYTGSEPEGPTEHIARDGYELLHSPVFKGPFWVCEKYTRASLVSRYDRHGLDFDPDPLLRLDHATDADYRDRTAYGFHIGHMAPAAAHSSTSARIADTFYYSNAIPQNSSLNSGMWANVEACARDSLPVNGVAWVITGPAYAPEPGEYLTYIGDFLHVPTHVWKVVVMQDEGGALTSWAIIVPNEKLPQGYRYETYQRSIDQVERITGFDLLPDLLDQAEKGLERKVPAYPCNRRR